MAVATTSQSTAPPNGATPQNITDLVKDNGPKIETSAFPQDVQTSAMRSLPLSLIHPSKTNPRKSFDGPEFDELVDSVRLHGVIVPLIVRHAGGSSNSDQYEIVAGERRFRAATKCGLKEVSVIVRDLTDERAQEFQIIENLQRQDVTPMEEAEGYVKLCQTYTENSKDYPRAKIVDELARKVGKSTRYIYARMKLAELHPEVKQAIADGKLPASHGDELVRLPAEQQRKLVKEILATPGDAPSVKDLRRAIKGKPEAKAQTLPPGMTQGNWDCLQASKKMRADNDARGGIMGVLEKLKFDDGSPFYHELLTYRKSLLLDAQLIGRLLDAPPGKQPKQAPSKPPVKRQAKSKPAKKAAAKKGGRK